MDREESEYRPIRVLIVDDSQDIAEWLKILIGQQGYDVRIALDGRGALAIASEFEPDICILDICLPDFDGFEVARRLRHARNGPGMAIVALTGLMGYVSADSSAYKDFDYHLIKPAQPKDILVLLSKINASLRSTKVKASRILAIAKA